MTRYHYQVEFDYDNADAVAAGFAQAMSDVLDDLGCGDGMVSFTWEKEEE